MKNSISNGALVVIMIGMAGLYYLQLKNAPIVYVNTSLLLNRYEGMIAARSDFEKKAQAWKANIDTLTVEVQNAIMEYEKGTRTMTVREKELGRQLIEAKQEKLANYQRAIRDKSKQEDFTATQAVIAEVNAYLKAYGEEHGYRIILAATEVGNIAYADEGLDITEEVVEGLNKAYRGE